MLDRTKLFGLFEMSYIQKWREEIEKEIENDVDYGLFDITDSLRTLGVDDKTIKIVIARIQNRQDYIHLNIENQLINLCIEIGMELGVDEYIRDNP